MTDKAHVKFIGDIHGEQSIYMNILKTAEHTVQVGDLDFDYSFLEARKVDSERHRFFAGNHDNYDVLPACVHNLGDFGVHRIPDFGDVFFVRGGWSIDRAARVNHDIYNGKTLIRRKDLWDEEELSHKQCNEALELYEQVKPKLVVSHECPLNIVQYVTNPLVAHGFGFKQSVIKTRTSQLLQAMTDIHRPRMHIFGHYHVSFDAYVNGVSGEYGWAADVDPSSEVVPAEHREYFTRYVCLGIMKTLTLPKNFVDTL